MLNLYCLRVISVENVARSNRNLDLQSALPSVAGQAVQVALSFKLDISTRLHGYKNVQITGRLLYELFFLKCPENEETGVFQNAAQVFRLGMFQQSMFSP